jgi:cell division protein FtsI/penicillin-binding protein 2
MQRIARQGWRQLVLLLVMLVAFSVVGNGLVHLQVKVNASDQSRYASYYSQDVAAPQIQKPVRGIIDDTNGQALVGSVTVYKLAVMPPYVPKGTEARTARLITDVLYPVRLPGGSMAHDPGAIAAAKATYRQHYETILAYVKGPYNYMCLAGDDSQSCLIGSDLNQSVASKISALGLPGVDLEARSEPNYPDGALAAQVLGYVTQSYPPSAGGMAVDLGQYGVEGYYNSLLAGVPGHTSVRLDTSGQAIRVGVGSDLAAREGATLRLTLDSYVQYFVEQDLVQAVKKTRSTGGTIIVERPSDGAILAMASVPSYSPADWRSIANSPDPNAATVFTDPAISDQYEPGSTFKVFMVAIGLDSSSFTRSSQVMDNGSLSVDGITITNWCGGSCDFLGPETPARMLHYSANIGATLFGRRIPVTTWYDYLSRLGFGQTAGIDLAGEVPGAVAGSRSDQSGLIWEPSIKDTQAYGQGISVTPLQLVNALSALANGGLLMQPHLLQSYTLDGRTYDYQPKVIRRIVSPATARTVTSIMVNSAVGGEACEALVPGYDIAAKTGTASIPTATGYDPTLTIASTEAFAPAEDPQFAVLVKLDKPRTGGGFGSETAAPVVHDIMRRLFEYYKIAPAAQPRQPQSSYCAYPFQGEPPLYWGQ